MKTNEKASVSLLRIILISIILIFILAIAVRATNIQINSVKVVLSNNCEMDVFTTKTKVSEILKENNIVVLPDETVIPSLDSELKENEVIKITKDIQNAGEVIEIAEANPEVPMEQILGNYDSIVEKVITEQVVIPFETITKDVSNGSADTTNKVLQAGVEGLKEVTYKIKYQNDVEIERTVLKENIIKQPVNKIVQVQTTATSRASVDREKAAANGSSLAQKVEGITPKAISMSTSAYCPCAKCCGKTTGITSSGAKATEWYTVAAGKGYAIGTIIYVPALSDKPNGGWFVVQDRGGAISNSKIDIFFGSHSEAISYGRKTLECYVYEF